MKIHPVVSCERTDRQP